MATKKVAIITGGASGMGLAVAKSLAATNWKVYILDLNKTAGEVAMHENQELAFSHTDVNSYDSLSSAFDKIFKFEGRLDVVFANAGILQMENFYEKASSLPPPEPRQLSIDINLKAVINTSYLASHYFLAPGNPCQDPVLVMTASVASFEADGEKYAQEFNPLYTASKAGVLGFMRSVAYPFFNDGIRTYAICPGTIRTNLLTSKMWDAFPEEQLTPVETVVSTVQSLIDGGDLTDANGKTIPRDKSYGLAVEIFGQNIFFRDQMEYSHDGLRQLCEAASLKNQQGNLASNL
ncbi:3-beta-hydroxysteroid dehydrogenase [Fusarium albosuccineum]|uniref:3-beta-hydroxysteroid dehydrogenase n=1 Tax=Fusarium albosuccineum TaxID=1237068 RepID=A0A8H4L2W2_9HYPO|nr:3-beta-hydroxysteroid dehydrogenase [Fusarium albosuccineum]